MDQMMDQRSAKDRAPVPPPAADDGRTIRRFLAVAAACFAAGLLFLAVAGYVAVRDGGMGSP